MRYFKYLPMMMLFVFIGKIISIGSTDLPTMGIILGLISLTALFEYKDNDKTIKELTANVANVNSEIEALKKDNKELHVFINAAKITDAFKGMPKRF